MQPAPAKPTRGVTVGIAVELFGITVTVFGVGASYTSVAGGNFFSPDPPIMALGVLIVLIGLILHIARV